jgi:hypothetical protein
MRIAAALHLQTNDAASTTLPAVDELRTMHIHPADVFNICRQICRSLYRRRHHRVAHRLRECTAEAGGILQPAAGG